MRVFQKFSYNSAHLTKIKRYIAWLGFFAVGILAVGVLQLIMLMKSNNLSTATNVICFACLIACAIFFMFMVAEIIKNGFYIKKIKDNGFVEGTNVYVNYNNKLSVGNIYRFIQYIIFTACALFVASFATIAILEYLYYETINYFFPAVFMLLITSFYTLKMVEHKYDLEKG